MNLKTQRKRMVLAGVLAVMLAGGNFCAWSFDGHNGPYGGNERKKDGMREKFIKKLDLSPEQQEQMKKQREAHRAQRKEINRKMKDLQDQLKTELNKEQVNSARVDGIASEMKGLQSSLVDQRIEAVLSMKNILTPEQYKKMQELKEKKKQGKKDIKGKKKGGKKRKIKGGKKRD
ncbi:MAG: Spy/CpxP family protein refolding chaperone [bacterium]